MKKIIALLMLILFISCADTKRIDGIKYNYYGFFNQNTEKNPDIEYRIVLGNVVWGIIFAETIVVPVIIIGWALFEPVGASDSTGVKGALYPAPP